LYACQDPGAPGAPGTLLEPPDSPDRNLPGTCQEPVRNRAGLPGDTHTPVPDRTLSGA